MKPLYPNKNIHSSPPSRLKSGVVCSIWSHRINITHYAWGNSDCLETNEEIFINFCKIRIELQSHRTSTKPVRFSCKFQVGSWALFLNFFRSFLQDAPKLWEMSTISKHFVKLFVDPPHSVHLQYLVIICDNLMLFTRMGFLMTHSHALCAQHSYFPTQTSSRDSKK